MKLGSVKALASVVGARAKAAGAKVGKAAASPFVWLGSFKVTQAAGSVLAAAHKWSGVKLAITDPVKHACESAALIILVLGLMAGAFHYGQHMAGTRDAAALTSAEGKLTKEVKAKDTALAAAVKELADYKASHPEKPAAAPAPAAKAPPAKVHKTKVKKAGGIFG